MRTAAMGLAGLWKNHDNELSVEETVRNMRKGRNFDHWYGCYDLVSQRKPKGDWSRYRCNAFFNFDRNIHGTCTGYARQARACKMKKALADMNVEIIPLSEEVSLRASDYVETYSLSHSMELADALIAATCVAENDTLVTANDKHYKVVQALQMTVFRLWMERFTDET